MRIAVIGTGIAGLGAAWLLSRAHDVAVFERNHYAGGHSNTVTVPSADGTDDVPVDTGFIVYNERTYPNLIGLLDELDVERIPTDMSFAVSADGGRLEYGGGSLVSLYAQKRNLVRPRFHRMVGDILRFYREAPSLIDGGRADDVELGAFLERHSYSQAFVEDHLLPMAAAIWSCPPSAMMRFPAASFVRFFDNHGLLKVVGRPQWWTVKGGSRRYVNRIRQDLDGRIHLNAPVVSVRGAAPALIVRTADGRERTYDRVVLACHGDEACRMVADKSDAEVAILGGFSYQHNRAVLHSDPSLMPRRRKVWSSWNYLSGAGGPAGRRVSVSYWMNRLQSLDPENPMFVSLNPLHEPDPDRTHRSIDYDHPVFDVAAIDAQRRLPEIQGRRGLYFCGSYCGYGFHEDGLGSAVAVARALGVEAPWGHRPVHAMQAVGPDPEAARGARARQAVA